MDKTKNFINRSNIIHNFKYTYENVVYVASNKKVSITCREHGDFLQSPNIHLSGRGCSKCYGNNKKTIEDFVKQVNILHNFKYDYSLVNYVNTTTKVKIICPEHGVFEQKAGAHLEGKGCNKCARLKAVSNLKSNTSEFIKKSNKKHKNFYNYLKTNYINSRTKVIITCNLHGDFQQEPRHHLNGQGCPKCKGVVSKREVEVQNFIKSLGFEIKTNNRKLLNGKELDIYIPSLNKAIEFNGKYWHYNENFTPGKHSNKSNLCREKGIKLLHIREDLWLKNKEKMKNVIKLFLKPPK